MAGGGPWHALARNRVFVADWVVTLCANVAMGLAFTLRNLDIRNAGIRIGLIGTLSSAGLAAFSLGGLLLAPVSARIGRWPVLIAGSATAHAPHLVSEGSAEKPHTG
jgi:hypothetical protein